VNACLLHLLGCRGGWIAPNEDRREAKPGARPMGWSSVSRAAGHILRVIRRGAPAIMDVNRAAKFGIGQQVRHRFFPFRGIIFDVDPEFANTEEWWTSIPEEVRPVKNQPFYHLLAENDSSYYVAYVSEQNLLADDGPEPVNHPQIPDMFEIDDHGAYRIRSASAH
jgi:heat shock protein HspQ